jgi:orotate phosphoribosyltransferase
MTRDEIEQLQRYMQNCFKYDGPYTLSSGRTAEYYYDGREATLLPPAAWLIGNAMVPAIVAAGAEAVGGLEVGAVPISDACGLAAHVQGKLLPTFIVRKQAKQHGVQSRLVQAQHEGGPLLAPGRRVAIVDDVITTGGSIQQAVDAVREAGCVVATVIALVERHESGGTALRGQGFPVQRLFWTDEAGKLSVDDAYFAAVR